MKRKTKSKQVNKNESTGTRISRATLAELRIVAAQKRTTSKKLIEEALEIDYGIRSDI